MVCLNCKAEIPGGNRFCEECGTPVPILCSSCGGATRPGMRFCGNCGRQLAMGAADALAVPFMPQASQRAPPAERRQLTVMFCDLVGSTGLAAQLDPEDLAKVFGAYHECVAATIARFDGFVAKYMGDGVLVYFGYPQAHEDDAERAVRAGLELATTVHALKTPFVAGLQVRIGVATGLVVVGDIIGAGAAQEQAVVGEAPNLAARLQGIADPGAVVIGPGTKRLLGGIFEYSDLGPVAVKGFAEPVPAWHVLRESAAQDRFEAFHAAALTPLVGREEELELLHRRWQRAKGGEGQVVLLSAEPGVGKSRLVASFREQLRFEPHRCRWYFCSPYCKDSALHPFISYLEQAAGFQREDTAEVKLAKLEAFSRSALQAVQVAPLLAELLLPRVERSPSLSSGPEVKKQRMLLALLQQLEHLSGKDPVLVVFEDAQWTDPTSLELLILRSSASKPCQSCWSSRSDPSSTRRGPVSRMS